MLILPPFARCVVDLPAVSSIRSLSCRFARCLVDSPAVLLMRWRWCRFTCGVAVGPLGRPPSSSLAFRPSSSLPFLLSLSLLPRPRCHSCCRCRSPSPRSSRSWVFPPLSNSENEPRRLSWLVFHDLLQGPPISWVPFIFLPPRILHRARLGRPHPFGKGRGG